MNTSEEFQQKRDKSKVEVLSLLFQLNFSNTAQVDHENCLHFTDNMLERRLYVILESMSSDKDKVNLTTIKKELERQTGLDLASRRIWLKNKVQEIYDNKKEREFMAIKIQRLWKIYSQRLSIADNTAHNALLGCAADLISHCIKRWFYVQKAKKKLKKLLLEREKKQIKEKALIAIQKWISKIRFKRLYKKRKHSKKVITRFFLGIQRKKILQGEVNRQLRKTLAEAVQRSFQKYIKRKKDRVEVLKKNIFFKIMTRRMWNHWKALVYEIEKAKAVIQHFLTSCMRKQERKQQLDREKIEKEKEKKQREKIEREKMEREKMEREKMEREKMEREKMEREKMEREKMEREKMEREKMEREKMEREKMEREKMEREKMEREKMEREKMEREKFVKEKLEKEKFEKEKLEKEKLVIEKLEIEKLEIEKLEIEKLEIEKLEKEKLEIEKLKKESCSSDEWREKCLFEESDDRVESLSISISPRRKDSPSRVKKQDACFHSSQASRIPTLKLAKISNPLISKIDKSQLMPSVQLSNQQEESEVKDVFGTSGLVPIRPRARKCFTAFPAPSENFEINTFLPSVNVTKILKNTTMKKRNLKSVDSSKLPRISQISRVHNVSSKLLT